MHVQMRFPRREMPLVPLVHGPGGDRHQEQGRQPGRDSQDQPSMMPHGVGSFHFAALPPVPQRHSAPPLHSGPQAQAARDSVRGAGPQPQAQESIEQEESQLQAVADMLASRAGVIGELPG